MKAYTEEEVFDIIKKLYRMPIQIKINFSVSSGIHTIYPGVWRFSHYDDIIKKLNQ